MQDVLSTSPLFQYHSALWMLTKLTKVNLFRWVNQWRNCYGFRLGRPGPLTKWGGGLAQVIRQKRILSEAAKGFKRLKSCPPKASKRHFTLQLKIINTWTCAPARGTLLLLLALVLEDPRYQRSPPRYNVRPLG